jgi:hypothetical protein
MLWMFLESADEVLVLLLTGSGNVDKELWR